MTRAQAEARREAFGQARTREVCAKCLKSGFPVSSCAYCDAFLASRHEHDHMPVPLRAGGVEYVPICVNCHDLKDRTDPGLWNSQQFFNALEAAPPIAKIVIAKLLGDLHDLQARQP